MVELLSSEDLCTTKVFKTTRFFVKVKNFVSYVDICLTHSEWLKVDVNYLLNNHTTDFFKTYKNYCSLQSTIDVFIDYWYYKDLDRQLRDVDINQLGYIEP
jgi:hypothetical protein